MKIISIIGSTGSIGTQTLEVVDHLKNIKVAGLSANNDIRLLEEQIRKYKPVLAAVVDEEKAAQLAENVKDTDTKIVSGIEGVCSVATIEQAEMVVTSVVGIAGLLPTMEAIKAGKDIALANKETLVTAGEIIIPLAIENKVKILPVDSEHCAIAQCITGKGVNRLILTASGGAFFGKTANELANVTVVDALQHPNWSMGRKITIDSATLMNKALEVIEAHHLFNMPYDRIDVIIHRESVIHSMVEYVDNSVLAQLATPDMKLPIQSALTYPIKTDTIIKQLNLAQIGKLTFFEPDLVTYKALRLGYRAGKVGGTMPTVLNAANEVAVNLFLDGKIPFLQIVDLVEKAMDSHKTIINPTIHDIIKVDEEIRGDMNC